MTQIAIAQIQQSRNINLTKNNMTIAHRGWSQKVGFDDSSMRALERYLAERVYLVEQALPRLLPPPDRYPDVLHRAMHYATSGGGKRIRPVLCIAAAEMIARDREHVGTRVMPTACAIELIHCSSLVCDDLPAFDGSPTRRGKDACHVAFGDALAILAEHALFSHAFALIARQSDVAPLDRVITVLAAVAEAASSDGMVGGQAVDMLSKGGETDSAALQYIHHRKTGSLIRAALLAGAVLEGASADEQAAVAQYGRHLGLAYQITDDILDETGDAATLGKPQGYDKESGKATYPSLYGLEVARCMAANELEAALTALSLFERSADPLRWLACSILLRRR